VGVHCEGRVFARGGFSSVISAKGAAEQRATPLHGKHSAAPFAAAAAAAAEGNHGHGNDQPGAEAGPFSGSDGHTHSSIL